MLSMSFYRAPGRFRLIQKGSQKKNILKAFGNDQATNKQIEEVIRIFKETGSIKYCEKIAKQKIKKAINYLNQAKPAFLKKSKDFFEELAFFMLDRKK